MLTITISVSFEQLQQLLQNSSFTISTVGDNMVNVVSQAPPSFFTLMSQRIEQLRQSGSIRTAETYKSALLQLRRFWDAIRKGDEDMTVNEVTPHLMEQYQQFLRRRDLTMNTVSFYMRRLRAVYRRAVRSGLVSDCQPFSTVYTGIAKTQKRALTMNDIRTLKCLHLDDPRQALARDLFLFSFYTRGMSFVDMAYLLRSNLSGGMLSYRRQKTGQLLTVRWLPCMQAIVDSHVSRSGQYMLPIISGGRGQERNQYRHKQSVVNKQLKEVARLAGLTVNLTMYCARHTWATVANSLHVPMSVISHAMGHTNARTTEVYIRTADAALVDQANERIIGLMS